MGIRWRQGNDQGAGGDGVHNGIEPDPTSTERIDSLPTLGEDVGSFLLGNETNPTLR